MNNAIEDFKNTLLLSMYAHEHGEKSAMALARKLRIRFNREDVIDKIEELYGKDSALKFHLAVFEDGSTADVQEQVKMNSVPASNFGNHLSKYVEHLKDRISKTASELAQALNPASFPTMVFNRDQNKIATIEPIIDLEGNKLFILLTGSGGIDFNNKNPRVDLFIDGVIQSSGKTNLLVEDTKLHYVMEVDSAYIAKHCQMSCTLHCNLNDINEIVIELNSN